MRTLIQASLIAAVLAAPAFAQDNSPVGLWKNLDDETGKPRTLIRITENQGELQGRIEKLFRPAGEDQNPTCGKCEGARKDQPLIGMMILSGLKKDGDEYTGGEILDPNSGRVFKSKVTLKDGGKKLEVRGYIGTPLFGGTKTWVREQ